MLSAHILTAYGFPVLQLAITPIPISAYIIAPSFIVIPMWCTIVVPFSLVFKWKITSITSIIHANSSWKGIRKEKIWHFLCWFDKTYSPIIQHASFWKWYLLWFSPFPPTLRYVSQIPPKSSNDFPNVDITVAKN